MTLLVLAELHHNALHASTRHAVTAALQIGGEIHVLVAGKDAAGAAKQAAGIAGVAKVLHADDAAYAYPLAENIAPLVASIGKNYSHILATATTTGKDIMPRAAALLDVSQVSDIMQVISPDTFRRPFYAGNAIETVKTDEAVKVITVRQTAFAAAADGGSASVETLAAQPASNKATFVSVQESKSERPELTAARIVVSGGRGIGSAENFKHLEVLADKLGAAMGASRAAVDAGYVPNDWQVGQTGKVVAPDLYIAIGISGAIQHLAGMKDSKVIVAINKDENAPIFEVADYGLVADWNQAVPELVKLLG
ncbi:MAG: electron transfer flavoprotein subunit alpha/FixB family protein [Alphaproteobacteria bacterium]